VAKAAALTTVGVLGLLAAFEPPWSSAGDPPAGVFADLAAQLEQLLAALALATIAVEQIP
jgi:hypothetical protein